jgi:hypothetical protein
MISNNSPAHFPELLFCSEKYFGTMEVSSLLGELSFEVISVVIHLS